MSSIESSRERKTSTFHLMSIAPNVAFRRHIYYFHEFCQSISQLSLKPGEEERKGDGGGSGGVVSTWTKNQLTRSQISH